MLRFISAALFLLLAAPTWAQEADPVDVESIDAVLGAVFEVISGPVSEERDWDRLRTLVHPEARFTSTGPGAGGAWVATVMTTDQYIELMTQMLRNSVFEGRGFYEVEVARRVERYGNIAHVWSTYENRFSASETAFNRGLITFQLVFDGTGWKVMSVLRQAETSDAPIPAEYLPEGE